MGLLLLAGGIGGSIVYGFSAIDVAFIAGFILAVIAVWRLAKSPIES